MYVQPLDGPLGPNTLTVPAGIGDGQGTLTSAPAAPPSGDNISRFVPPWFNDGGGNSGSLQGLFGPLMGVLQQLTQMLQSLMGYGCNGSYAGSAGTGCPPSGNERFFQNASGASNGDPHLSFNGARWNNMSSQPDLLNSNSFPGGFRISTQATPPNGKGVTWNQSATVSLNNGATTIGMNNEGRPSITSFGQSLSIARGQTLQLGDGESVTYEQNGSLRVCAQNGVGGRIDTTLTPDDKGVNVDVNAHDVDLGGALVNGWERREGHDPIAVPVSGPIASDPILGPPQTPITGPGPGPVPPIEWQQPRNYGTL